MSVLWLTVLVGVIAVALAGGLLRTERAYQYPFLACALVAMFILPQLPGIFADPQVPRSALSKTLFMTVLCLLAAIAGWSVSRTPATLGAAFDERRLSQIAVVFALGGALFYYRLSQLPGDAVVGVQMSGISVIYLFFGRLLTYGLLLAALLYARRPSWAMLAVIGFCLLFYVDRIVVTGKRAETMELLLIFLLAWWFHRRRKVSVTALVVGGCVGLVIMTSMSAYRAITQANSGVVLSEVQDIDALGNFEELLQSGGEEMRNAVALIDATDREAHFDFGAVHWNMVVSNYVPRQLFGARVKAALRLETPPWPRDFVPAVGTTLTGMSDAFRSFWYVGAIKFFLLGYVMRRLWDSAMQGQFLGQVLYCLSIVPAMHAFSHNTDWVVPVWIHALIFLAPALLYAQCKAAAPRASPGPLQAAGSRRTA